MDYNDYDTDEDDMDCLVQCGKCYKKYDPLENPDGKCPLCGSDEIVGDR